MTAPVLAVRRGFVFDVPACPNDPTHSVELYQPDAALPWICHDERRAFARPEEARP